ncbi:MAG: MFS transporter, partial [Pigmentiphaga sp.]
MQSIQPTTPSLWQRLAGVRPEEAPAVLWSMLYVIALFLAYYVLRPIRDELGVAGGVQNLPWLFTGTLLAMLVASPLFALAVRNLPRRQFITLAYRFFAANLVLFALLLQFAGPQWQVWVGRAFFIWVSVFNLFVVSVFWS